MKKCIITFVVFALLLCTGNSLSEQQGELLRDKLTRIALGDMTEEEMLIDRNIDLNSIIEIYWPQRYSSARTYGMCLELAVHSGYIKEEEALGLCAAVGDVQKIARQDYAVYRAKTSNRFASKRYAYMFVSFSAGIVILDTRTEIQAGWISGDRESVMTIEWSDGKTKECSFTREGSKELLKYKIDNVGYWVFEKIELEEAPEIMFYDPEY